MDDALDSEFLAVMAAAPAPVTVVTTLAGGTPYGTTVSAFASLSRRPPMVMVALDNGSQTLAQVAAAGRFGVNLLSADQSDVALRFAGSATDRFGASSWTVAEQLPRLGGVAGWVACELTALVPGGDHQILLGSVLAAEVGDTRPLVYSRRRFGTHRPAYATGLPHLAPAETTGDLDALNAHAMALLGWD